LFLFATPFSFEALLVASEAQEYLEEGRPLVL
jgi:hypothetical protein